MAVLSGGRCVPPITWLARQLSGNGKAAKSAPPLATSRAAGD